MLDHGAFGSVYAVDLKGTTIAVKVCSFRQKDVLSVLLVLKVENFLKRTSSLKMKPRFLTSLHKNIQAVLF
jgi:hypothetical protein